MTSISSSSSSCSSNNSKNKSISPLTNFINENYNQKHFSEFSKIEELEKSSEDNLNSSSSSSSQINQQMFELLTKAGFLTNSLLNKQENEQKNESFEFSNNLFNSNNLLNKLPFVQQQQQEDLLLEVEEREEEEREEGEGGEQLIGGQRKKRRLIGNLDNTLDGLVAKRVDMPLKKRYQSETEAIELPDDEQEMKKMETDPDVCTRMCSVCGYQGKWVSEMIRHKRVHTDDRPFKCKYCNRTSKWKADLIRHVAKTHGIRVVSKYSRSKAFDFGKNNNNKSTLDQQLTIDDVIMDLKEDNNELINLNNSSNLITNKIGRKQSSSSNNFSDSLNSMFRKAQRLNGLNRNTNNNNKLINRTKQKQQKLKLENNSIIKNSEINSSSILMNLFGGNIKQQLINNNNSIIKEQNQQQLLLSNNKLTIIPSQQLQKQQNYKCGLCIFQQFSYPLLVSHLLSVHNTSPFNCQNCHLHFTILKLLEYYLMQTPLSFSVQNFLPPSIFSLGLPTMGFSPHHLSGLSQLNGISQNCCSPGSTLSTVPSYGSLFNNSEKQKQTIKSEDNIDEINSKEQIKINSTPELNITTPISNKNNSIPLQPSPLEAKTADQLKNDNEDLFINVDDIKEEEKEKEEENKLKKDENDIKNSSMAALMFLNALQIQQKLTSTTQNITNKTLSNESEQLKFFLQQKIIITILLYLLLSLKINFKNIYYL
ncbi:hypothetical protein Mgra_00001520 [Meloidogyne graminicola]|uniref:C2H2-type domain-containing protein n=1 Tax=Meloidogyne graminicola TaxID=189291 RepID=A0A8S9ZYZ2_9BILA|nr:hypothetical protein Mgra_00001520 [Meloidogyne graminicola]